jgi:Fe-S-cluster containining protein
VSKKPTSPHPVASAPSAAWYRNGIRFGCTECGACCRREGFVWVSAPEIERLARHLDLPVAEFRSRYTMEVAIEGLAEPGVSLIRGPEACIFLDVATNRCTVYEARPAQCAAYPFWPRAVRSREDWARDVEAYCEKEAFTGGRLYTAAEIQSIVSRFSVAGGKPKPPKETGEGKGG